MKTSVSNPPTPSQPIGRYAAMVSALNTVARAMSFAVGKLRVRESDVDSVPGLVQR